MQKYLAITGQPFKNIQEKQPQSITYLFAFQKQFWNKNASAGFTATTPSNKYISQVTTVTTSNYHFVVTKLVPYQSFNISFNDKFGKLKFKNEIKMIIII